MQKFILSQLKLKAGLGCDRMDPSRLLLTSKRIRVGSEHYINVIIELCLGTIFTKHKDSETEKIIRTKKKKKKNKEKKRETYHI